MNEDSNADPAIKKDTSSLLHKEKNNSNKGKKEAQNEEGEEEKGSKK